MRTTLLLYVTCVAEAATQSLINTTVQLLNNTTAAWVRQTEQLFYCGF